MPAQKDIQPGNSMELVEVEVREFLEKAFRGEEEIGCPKGLLIMHLWENIRMFLLHSEGGKEGAARSCGRKNCG